MTFIGTNNINPTKQMDERTKNAIDMILASIRMEMDIIIHNVCDTYVRKRIIDACELGRSTGAIEALEAMDKKIVEKP